MQIGRIIKEKYAIRRLAFGDFQNGATVVADANLQRRRCPRSDIAKVHKKITLRQPTAFTVTDGKVGDRCRRSRTFQDDIFGSSGAPNAEKGCVITSSVDRSKRRVDRYLFPSSNDCAHSGEIACRKPDTQILRSAIKRSISPVYVVIIQVVIGVCIAKDGERA